MINQKPSLFKKILFIALGVFLIILSLISLIILFPDFLGLFNWDISLIDDSDLVSENKQALNYFSEAAKKKSFQDPFNGEPIKYSLEKKIIYSEEKIPNPTFKISF